MQRREGPPWYIVLPIVIGIAVIGMQEMNKKADGVSLEKQMPAVQETINEAVQNPAAGFIFDANYQPEQKEKIVAEFGRKRSQFFSVNPDVRLHTKSFLAAQLLSLDGTDSFYKKFVANPYRLNQSLLPILPTDKPKLSSDKREQVARFFDVYDRLTRFSGLKTKQLSDEQLASASAEALFRGMALMADPRGSSWKADHFTFDSSSFSSATRWVNAQDYHRTVQGLPQEQGLANTRAGQLKQVGSVGVSSSVASDKVTISLKP